MAPPTITPSSLGKFVSPLLNTLCSVGREIFLPLWDTVFTKIKALTTAPNGYSRLLIPLTGKEMELTYWQGGLTVAIMRKGAAAHPGVGGNADDM